VIGLKVKEMNTTGKVLTVVFAALACLASLAAAYYWRESSRTSFQMPYLVAIGKLNTRAAVLQAISAGLSAAAAIASVI